MSGGLLLLNRLLNEMDGLREGSEILFILTTNRPEALEAALASRPGRIDQAIEFPLPDDTGRARLLELYRCGLELPEALRVTARGNDSPTRKAPTPTHPACARTTSCSASQAPY
jgi:AAA+ superfamily predicted ATPase